MSVLCLYFSEIAVEEDQGAALWLHLIQCKSCSSTRCWLLPPFLSLQVTEPSSQESSNSTQPKKVAKPNPFDADFDEEPVKEKPVLRRTVTWPSRPGDEAVSTVRVNKEHKKVRKWYQCYICDFCMARPFWNCPLGGIDARFYIEWGNCVPNFRKTTSIFTYILATNTYKELIMVWGNIMNCSLVSLSMPHKTEGQHLPLITKS